MNALHVNIQHLQNPMVQVASLIPALPLTQQLTATMPQLFVSSKNVSEQIQLHLNLITALRFLKLANEENAQRPIAQLETWELVALK